MNIEILGVAVAAAWVLMKLVEAIISPLWDRFKLDRFWLLYVALAIGAPLGWFTGLDAFPVFAQAPVIGRVLTALVIGLGPSTIWDMLDGPKR